MSAEPDGHPALRVVSADELRERIARVEADKAEWQRLIDTYGTLEYGLEPELRSLRWLSGQDDHRD